MKPIAWRRCRLASEACGEWIRCIVGVGAEPAFLRVGAILGCCKLGLRSRKGVAAGRGRVSTSNRVKARHHRDILAAPRSVALTARGTTFRSAYFDGRTRPEILGR